MDKLVFLACKRSPECVDCKSNCEIFWVVKEKLKKFGEEVSKRLTGKEIIIAELRKEGWYKKVVAILHWNGYIVENSSFKKIEEELIRGLFGLRAQE